MELVWNYDLPADENSRDYSYTGPILVKDGKVFFLTSHIRQVRLHVLDDLSGGKILVHALPHIQSVTAGNYLLLDTGRGVLIYSGGWDLWQDGEGQLLYGTAGADGYLTSLDPITGQKNWSQFFKEGCEFFARYRDTVLAGDYGKTVKQLRLTDGTIADEITMDAEVVGRMQVDGGCAYTVIWGCGEGNVRLVKIELTYGKDGVS